MNIITKSMDINSAIKEYPAFLSPLYAGHYLNGLLFKYDKNAVQKRLESFLPHPFFHLDGLSIRQTCLISCLTGTGRRYQSLNRATSSISSTAIARRLAQGIEPGRDYGMEIVTYNTATDSASKAYKKHINWDMPRKLTHSTSALLKI